MKKYIVTVREVHTQLVEVMAESVEDAREKVADDKGKYLDDTLEYSHTLNKDTWGVDVAEETV